MEYIIETRNVGEAHAGAKAPDDIVSIARKRGMGVFTIPVLPNKTCKNLHFDLVVYYLY